MKSIFFKYLVFQFLFVSFFIFGEAKDVGILVKGPEKEMGFPYIYPNALKTWDGVYRYLDSDIKVYFTREFILRPSEWEKRTCGKISGFLPGSTIFFYQDSVWSLIFQFSLNERDSVKIPEVLSVKAQCLFIEKFIFRLRYLLRDSSVMDPPLFPAILEIR